MLTGLVGVVAEAPASAASTIDVTTASDGSFGALCSLRDAVTSANEGIDVDGCTGASATGPETIMLGSGTYTLTLGELDVGMTSGDDITIQGQGSGATTINQTTAASRVFNLDPNVVGDVAISITDVTITGGLAQAFGGGAILGGGTGDTLSLTNSILTGNGCSGSNSGAGINWSPAGNVTIDDTTFSDNTCAESAGAIFYTSAGGQLSISNSVFTRNTSGASGSAGGAIFLGQVGTSPTTFDIDHSSFTSNKATTGGIGGAIYVGSGALTATYDRITGNAAPFGGGIGVRGGSVTAKDDWWGCNAGPNTANCDSVNSNGEAVVLSPWITLTNSPSPTSVSEGGSSTLTASFLQDSSAAALTAADVTALDGVPVSWSSAVHGSLSDQENVVQSTGTATATLTQDGTCNSAGATAGVDNQAVPATVTVQCPDLTAALTDNEGGSVVTGQPWTWTITVANAGLGAASFASGQRVLVDDLPSGPNYGPAVSSDPGVSCSTVSLELTCTAAGPYTLTAGGSFTVQFFAGVETTGSYANPSAAGVCAVDPDNDVNETNVSNNSCADTVVVSAAHTTTTITGHTPDPSDVGEPVAVSFGVSVNAPGDGTPTGTVTVTDGVDSCTGPVAVGTCSITLTTTGPRTLTASYGGDTNFLSSTSVGVTQTVQTEGAPTITSTPSPKTAHVGATLQDAATLSNTGALDGTGTVTFRLFGPHDATCAAGPLDTETVTGVSSDGPFSTTTGYKATTAGTYHWTVSFSGDSDDQSAVSACSSEPVVITNAVPTVTAVSPDYGPATGGTKVTLTGTGFVAGAVVTIGQTYFPFTALDVVVVSSTAITFVTPGPAQFGTWNVRVKTPGGTSATSSGDLFSYYRLFVSKVSPNHGPTAGGTTLTITGSGFVPGVLVKLGQGHGAGPGSLQALDVQVVSPTQLTCVTPKHAKPGTWNVFVNMPGHGTSPPHPTDHFTYVS